MSDYHTIIKVTRHYDDEYTAITDDYDGPGSPQGFGNSWIEAVRDLLDQLEEDKP